MQAVQAAQITFKDYFMADLTIEPLQVVGWGMQSLDLTGHSLTTHAL